MALTVKYKNYFYYVTAGLLMAMVALHPIPSVAQTTSPAPWVHETLDGAPCQGRPQGFGPYDYLNRARFHKELDVVERAHFTPDVEQVIRGSTSSSIYGDIGYTISAWPNHHRALRAMMRLQSRKSSAELRRMRAEGTPPVECHLYRAVNFSPNDATVQMLLAMHLHTSNRPQMAVEWYERALATDPGHIEAQYNFALLLTDLKQYERARTLARQVYAAGFPLEGLRRKLERAGQWQ